MFMSSVLMRVCPFALGSFVTAVTTVLFHSFCVNQMILLPTQAPPLGGFDWADQGQQTRDDGDQVTERTAQLLLKLYKRFLIPVHTAAGRNERYAHSHNTPRLSEVRLHGIHTEIIIRQPRTRPIKPFCVYTIKELTKAF